MDVQRIGPGLVGDDQDFLAAVRLRQQFEGQHARSAQNGGRLYKFTAFHIKLLLGCLCDYQVAYAITRLLMRFLGCLCVY